MRVRKDALRKLTRPLQLLSFGLMLLFLTAGAANAQVWTKGKSGRQQSLRAVPRLLPFLDPSPAFGQSARRVEAPSSRSRPRVALRVT